jgi:hypothetical protein
MLSKQLPFKVCMKKERERRKEGVKKERETGKSSKHLDGAMIVIVF